MTHKLLLAAAAVVVASSSALPTGTPMVPSPPAAFAYTFAFLDPATGRIEGKLERTLAVLQRSKGKSTESSYTISGAKSAVRLRIAGAVFESISDPSTGTLNPSSYISLFKLSTGRTGRTLTMNSDGSPGATLIPVTFTTLDQLVHRISVTGAILPGEYALVDRTTTTADGNVTVWTFGID